MTVGERARRDHIGPYRIVARIGAGGMGEVFKAWDPRLERDVAIKLLHPETAGDARAAEAIARRMPRRQCAQSSGQIVSVVEVRSTDR